MKEKKRSIWSGRWGYPEGWAIVGGLLLISYIWQWVMGPIPSGGFTHPISTVVLGALIIATLLIGILSRKKGSKLPFVRFIVSPAATITSLVAFLLLLTIMGSPNRSIPGWRMVLADYSTLRAGVQWYIHTLSTPSTSTYYLYLAPLPFGDF